MSRQPVVIEGGSYLSPLIEIQLDVLGVNAELASDYGALYEAGGFDMVTACRRGGSPLAPCAG